MATPFKATSTQPFKEISIPPLCSLAVCCISICTEARCLHQQCQRLRHMHTPSDHKAPQPTQSTERKTNRSSRAEPCRARQRLRHFAVCLCVFLFPMSFSVSVVDKLSFFRSLPSDNKDLEGEFHADEIGKADGCSVLRLLRGDRTVAAIRMHTAVLASNTVNIKSISELKERPKPLPNVVQAECLATLSDADLTGSLFPHHATTLYDFIVNAQSVYSGKQLTPHGLIGIADELILSLVELHRHDCFHGRLFSYTILGSGSSGVKLEKKTIPKAGFKIAHPNIVFVPLEHKHELSPVVAPTAATGDCDCAACVILRRRQTTWSCDRCSVDRDNRTWPSGYASWSGTAARWFHRSLPA